MLCFDSAWPFSLIPHFFMNWLNESLKTGADVEVGLTDDLISQRPPSDRNIIHFIQVLSIVYIRSV